MNDVRIVLVDDEAALLRLMETFLDHLGYRVDACMDAHSAREMIARSDSGTQLAIVDLSIMKGTDMLVEFADIRPDLRILVCSGFPFEVDMLPERLRSRFSSLQKPFLPNMLTQAVEQLLNRPVDASTAS